jgi:hypothetical protein
MKKLLILCITLALSMSIHAENNVLSLNYHQDPSANFRLYPTSNIQFFIKLDTRTGVMEIIQWNEQEGPTSYMLSNTKRVSLPEEEVSGRFTLYATNSTHTLILIDQIDGRTWQVQWHTDPSRASVMRVW